MTQIPDRFSVARAVRRLATWRSKPDIVRYTVDLNGWQGASMRIAVISDFHVIAPWTQLRDLRRITATVNELAPDMVVLAGDFLADFRLPGRRANADEIAAALGGLQASAGVFAILGNHDWFDCPQARASNYRECSVIDAMARARFQLLRNESVAMRHGGETVWVVGFDSQRPTPADWTRGLHDPERAFADVPAEAPAILLAHEPDYFAKGDARAGLQISGHTHGGQLNLWGWRPMTPSHHRGRYAYGHIREGGRSLVVSAGIGFSGLPLRIGQAPEITIIEIEPGRDATLLRPTTK